MISDYFKAIILGIIEGLTEFIPVSSTGHLILAGDYLKLSSENINTFNISIQLGAILAVILIYRDFFLITFSPKNWFKKNMNNIIIACLPALFIGFFFHSYIKKYLFSSFTVTIALAIGGVVMILVERIFKQKPVITDIDKIGYKQALLIGLCQCFSFWPGMSRSGSTIVGGLLAKLDHQTSAKFSFIIGAPLIALAVIYELFKSFRSLNSEDYFLISIGFITSFIFGIAAIKTVISILKRFKLIPFAIYRIILSVFLISF